MKKNCTTCKHLTSSPCSFHKDHQNHYCSYFPKWVPIGRQCGEISNNTVEAHFCSKWESKVPEKYESTGPR